MAVQAYEGGCQCGAVRFKAEVDLDSLITCNCSRCGRTGAILAFTPRDSFSVTAADDAMTEYLFNTGKISHPFCKTCGIQAFGLANAPDGVPMAAVNVRCFDGVDVHTLKPATVDGKSF